jgi:hypothetical protein
VQMSKDMNKSVSVGFFYGTGGVSPY